MSESQMETVVFELAGTRDLIEKVEVLNLDAIGKSSLAARTLVSAISPGTEVSAYVGAPPLRPMRVYPRLVGYCNVAEVIAVGADVKQAAVGDLIATFQSHRSGFICEEADILSVIPGEADISIAATTYLFHLGYSALLEGGIKPGYNVGVIGLGTLGLATIDAASHAGAEVFGFSDQECNAKRGPEFGARKIFSRSDEQAQSEIDELTGGTGIDLIVTTSNSWEDWYLALEVVRPGGTIAVLGFPGRDGARPSFNPLDSRFLYDKHLTIVACNAPPDHNVPAKDIRFTLQRNYRYLLGLVLRGDLSAGKLISETVPWNSLGKIYERMDARESGLLTCVLDWR